MVLFFSLRTSDIRVLLGSHDLPSGTTLQQSLKTVHSITVHPSYNGATFDSDLAVLELANAVAYSRTISSACLRTNDPRDGTGCVVIGWGETEGEFYDFKLKIKF